MTQAWMDLEIERHGGGYDLSGACVLQPQVAHTMELRR